MTNLCLVLLSVNVVFIETVSSFAQTTQNFQIVLIDAFINVDAFGVEMSTTAILQQFCVQKHLNLQRCIHTDIVAISASDNFVLAFSSLIVTI